MATVRPLLEVHKDLVENVVNEDTQEDTGFAIGLPIGATPQVGERSETSNSSQSTWRVTCDLPANGNDGEVKFASYGGLCMRIPLMAPKKHLRTMPQPILDVHALRTECTDEIEGVTWANLEKLKIFMEKMNVDEGVNFNDKLMPIFMAVQMCKQKRRTVPPSVTVSRGKFLASIPGFQYFGPNAGATTHDLQGVNAKLAEIWDGIPLTEAKKHTLPYLRVEFPFTMRCLSVVDAFFHLHWRDPYSLHFSHCRWYVNVNFGASGRNNFQASSLGFRSLHSAKQVLSRVSDHRIELRQYKLDFFNGELSQAKKDAIKLIFKTAAEGIKDSCATLTPRSGFAINERPLFIFQVGCAPTRDGSKSRTQTILEKLKEVVRFRFPEAIFITARTTICGGHPCGKRSGLCKEWKDRRVEEKKIATDIVSGIFDATFAPATNKLEHMILEGISNFPLTEEMYADAIYVLLGNLAGECLSASHRLEGPTRVGALLDLPHPTSIAWTSKTGREDIANVMAQIGVVFTPDSINQSGWTKRKVTGTTSCRNSFAKGILKSSFMEREAKQMRLRKRKIHIVAKKKAQHADNIKEGKRKVKDTAGYWQSHENRVNTAQDKRQKRDGGYQGALSGFFAADTCPLEQDPQGADQHGVNQTSAIDTAAASSSGTPNTFHRKHDLEHIVEIIRAAPAQTHPVDLAFQLSIPFNNLKAYWFTSRIRKEKKDDAALLHHIDCIERAPGSHSRWESNLDPARCKRMASLGLSLQKIALLGDGPVWESDVKKCIGQQPKLYDVSLETIVAIAKEFPSIPDDRLIKVCCGALHEKASEVLAAIQEARGSTPLCTLPLHLTSRVALLFEAMQQGARQGEDKHTVRWKLCWKETQYSKVWGELKKAIVKQPNLKATLEAVHNKPARGVAWSQAEALWKQNVDVPLAKALLSIGLSAEDAALLCPGPTLAKHIEQALRNTAEGAEPALQGERPAAAFEKVRALSLNFPLLDMVRAEKVCSNSDIRAKTSI